MMRHLVDANVLLRFLRNDDPVQSPRARALMARAQRGEVVLAVSILTMADVFYALRTSYKVPRPTAAELLSQLLLSNVLEIEQESILADALARIKAANVDLGDAVLAAQAAASGDPVATFDWDFTRFPDVRCHQWE